MWVDLDSAVVSVMEKATHGAHVFYWEDKGFMVKRDSKNGISAEQTITFAPAHYAGFFRNRVFVDKHTSIRHVMLVEAEDVYEELQYVIDNPPYSRTNSLTNSRLYGSCATFDE